MEIMTALPRGREFTRDDLATMPDDGNRYELIDGLLVVSPAPTPRHQGVITELLFRLRSACPEDLRVRCAPLDIVLSEHTVLQPDLLVARPGDFSVRDLPKAPVLAVEVLSASTRLYDLQLKRAHLEQAGCPHYWVVDPLVPSIIAWELVDGSYRVVAEVSGEAKFSTRRPFPVDFRPAELID